MHVQPITCALAPLVAASMVVCIADLPAQAQSVSGNAPPVAAPPAAYYPPPGYYPAPGYYPPPPGYYPAPGYYPPAASYVPPPPPEPPPPSEPPRGHHEHDGFYLSVRMGFDHLYASDGRLGATETIAGLGLAMDYALGFAVVPNLVLFGNMTVDRAVDPTHTYSGKSETLTNTEMDLYGFGTGLAYYVEPLNAHVSGTVSLSWLKLSDTSNTSNGGGDFTDFGFGASLAAGKEWWVSSNWGLGAATVVRFASMKLKDYDARLTATSISLLFSATFN